MLQILRNKAQSTFIQIIVVIIALVFIFWGVGTNMMSKREAALVVNDEEISFQEFQQAYDQAYQRLAAQFGGNLPKGLADSLGIKDQVINQLVQTALLRQGAQEMGVLVSNEEVRRTIEEMPQFRENGTFSMDRYQLLLSSNRMSPIKFEDSIRYDRLSEVTARSIGAFAAATSTTELKEIYEQINEEIEIDFVELQAKDFQAKVALDEAAMQAWFDQAKERYKTQPKVQLSYLVFSFSDVGKKIVIDEDKIEQYYQDNLDRYRDPETRHARHILLKAGDSDSAEIHESQRSRAQEILELAKGGREFTELAKEYSEGPSAPQGGDLGYFPAGRMVPEFDQVVQGLQKGELSKVVKTQFGYHIILLEDIKPAATRPLSEVREEIVTTLQREEGETMAFQLANAAYEGIIGAGSLAKYIEKNPEAGLQSTGFFDRDSAPAELAGDPAYLDQIFKLAKGELSSLTKGQTGYAIFSADALEEPSIPAFAEIKEKITEDYREEKAKELAKQAADTMLAELKSGKELAALASDQGVAVKSSGRMKQSDNDSGNGFPAALRAAAFMLAKASPYPETPGEDAGNHYIYQLTERHTPELPADSEELNAYRDNLVSLKQRQVLGAWLQQMESQATITRHPSL